MDASNKAGVSHFTVLAVIAAIFFTAFLANPQVIVDWRTYSFDDGTYSHAYLMPLVIGFFFWQAAQQQQLQLRWNGLIFVAFLIVLAIFLLFQVAQQNVLGRLVFPLVILAALGSLIRLNTSLVVPVTLLWFITPVWMPLNGILQSFSVSAVTYIMSFTNIPFYVDGNFVEIPSGIFEIADGCSGLRYVIVALALAVIYCHLNLTKKRNVVIFFSVAIIGSMITNWIRIALLIYIGDYTDMQSSLMDDHNFFGWYIFIPFVGLLFFVGNKLERNLPAIPAAQPQATKLPLKPLIGVITVLVLVSGSSIQLLNTGNLNWSVSAINLEAEPVTASYQQPTPVVFTASSIEIAETPLADRLLLQQKYSFNGETDGHKPDYYQNNMVPEGWWQTDKQVIGAANLTAISNNAGEHALLMYWYQIDNMKTASSSRFKRYRLAKALTLKQRSELHWYFIACEQQHCQHEFQLLTGLAPQN